MYSWSIRPILTGIVLNFCINIYIATRQSRAIADMAAARGGGKKGEAKRGREQDIVVVVVVDILPDC